MGTKIDKWINIDWDLNDNMKLQQQNAKARK